MSDYDDELSKLTPREWNAIIDAVNQRVPKEEMDFASEAESRLFDNLVAEANEFERRGGVRPIFDLCELD